MPKKQLNNSEMLKRAFQVSTCAVGAAALLCFSGCASTTYQKADAASESLRTAQMGIDAESRGIDLTLATLDDLVNQPAPDLKPQFTSFSASLDRLIDSSKQAEKAANVAEKKSAAYLESWDQETSDIKYQAVRDQSVSRKTQVSNEFSTVNQRYRENQAVVEPLISYLRDIRTALGSDLTTRGIQVVKPLADNARENARKVQSALARLSDDLSASGARLSSVAPPDSQPKGGVSDTTEATENQAQSSR